MRSLNDGGIDILGHYSMCERKSVRMKCLKRRLVNKVHSPRKEEEEEDLLA